MASSLVAKPYLLRLKWPDYVTLPKGVYEDPLALDIWRKCIGNHAALKDDEEIPSVDVQLSLWREVNQCPVMVAMDEPTGPRSLFEGLF